MALQSWNSNFVMPTVHNPCRTLAGGFFAALLALASLTTHAQSPPQKDVIIIEGTVRSSRDGPIGGATVVLEEKGQSGSADAKSKPDGSFGFLTRRTGTYVVKAEKSGFRSAATEVVVVSVGEKKHVELVLQPSAGTPAAAAPTPQTAIDSGGIEFEDKLNFRVAGVTDPSSAGGHGSSTTTRTGEALARETAALKSRDGEAQLSRPPIESEAKLRAAFAQMPASFAANHELGDFYYRSGRYSEAIPLLASAYKIDAGNFGNAYELVLAYQRAGDFAQAREHTAKLLTSRNTADLHHLLGDLSEQSGDPLAAVREYEEAVRLERSERNYFDWGAELLVHKAAQPAIEVFNQGTKAYPKSARMMAGLGAALYSSGLFEEAAHRLCAASDLGPSEPAPYIFLGKMQKAASTPLPCAEHKLSRFVQEQPGNALANYYYGMSLWKRDRRSGNPAGIRAAENLLERALTIDPKLDDGYVQLGILFSERGEFEKAIRTYKKALDANPDLGDAHYRLGLAYKRIGHESEAQQEFQLYEQAQKAETAASERERRELRQFLVTLKDQRETPSPQ